MLDWSYKQKAVVLLVLGVVCLVYFRHRIYNGTAGPFDVEVRDVVLMEEVPTKEWVRVVHDGQPVKLTITWPHGDRLDHCGACRRPARLRTNRRTM